MVTQVSVFLGAGVSDQFGVSHDLLTGFLRRKSSSSRSRFLLAKLRRYGIEPTLENLLTIVDSRADPSIIRSMVGPFIPEIADRQRLQRLRKHREDKELAERLRDYIFRKCFISEAEQIDKVENFFLRLLIGVRDYFGLTSDLKNLPNLPIFTTNFDNAFEQFCRRQTVGLYDGYDSQPWGGVQFNHRLYSKEFYSDRFKIYKLHGTVRYVRSSEGELDELTLLPSRGRITINGRPAFPDLVYSERYQYISNSPQLELLYLLKERLRISDRIIAIGYSFGDPHIYTIFKEVLSENKRLIICNPDTNVLTKFGSKSNCCIAVPVHSEDLDPLRDFAEYQVPK